MGLTPLLVLAVVVLVLVVRERAGAGGDVAQDRPGTVLLVAGYGGSTTALESLRVRLRAAGRSAEIVPPVGDNTGDLRAQARQLDAAARRAVADGAPSVDVVGYSAGGVVARIWVADLGGDELARRVVTLGSPHHGTEVAGLAAGLAAGACPPACRELVPGSDAAARPAGGAARAALDQHLDDGRRDRPAARLRAARGCGDRPSSSRCARTRA